MRVVETNELVVKLGTQTRVINIYCDCQLLDLTLNQADQHGFENGGSNISRDF